MTKVDIRNPTHRSKAVKVPGDMLVLKPGTEKKGVDVNWSKDQADAYRRAGIVFRKQGEKWPGEEDAEAEVKKEPEPKPVAEPSPPKAPAKS